MIAIHNSNIGFHPRWVEYCKEKAIPYKIIDCYANNIIKELDGCHTLMWHHSQSNPKDILFAKQLLFSLEQAGVNVFPNFNTSWHFDDKLGQKYLLEALGVKMVPTHVFYSLDSALSWIESCGFPKVFKLRGGAGSANVQLVRNKKRAIQLAKQAFGRGFKQYRAWDNLKERWRKFRLGKTSSLDIIKGVIRFGYEPRYSKIAGRERGYIYFQEFIPENDSDTRIIVIDGKAFALKRMVRENDFRASGSGDFKYQREEFDERCVQIAFDLTKELNAQCIAYDFVFDGNNIPLVVEISYGFTPSGYDDCPGYWTEDMQWHEKKFNAQGWMVDMVLH